MLRSNIIVQWSMCSSSRRGTVCILREARHGTGASPHQFAGVTHSIAAAERSSSSSAVSTVQRLVLSEASGVHLLPLPQVSLALQRYFCKHYSNLLSRLSAPFFRSCSHSCAVLAAIHLAMLHAPSATSTQMHSANPCTAFQTCVSMLCRWRALVACLSFSCHMLLRVEHSFVVS
jgi:hypothetical protein